MSIFDKCKIEDELIDIVNTDKGSIKKRIARICERYYEADHDIKQYRIFYFNSEGELVEDTHRSNVKISHAFYTENVDTEVDHMLSKFSITSKISELDKELKKYFDFNFVKELHDMLEGTVKIGWSYMYSQLGSDFRTRFKNADGIRTIEVREKNTDEIIYFIYYYFYRIKQDNTVVTRIEVHDKEQTFYYILDNNNLREDDKVNINPRPHKVWNELVNGEIKTYGEGFGYFPFFRLDNNQKQISGLKPIKALIDDYDLMSCGLSNNLQDVQEAIYVVKGFQGSDLSELQTNLRTKKIIGVPAGENTGLDIKTIDIPYEARKTKLELDEKNIYRFGMSFNAAQSGDGNITNIIIKSRYTLLELKCNKLAIRLRAFLEDLIKIVLNEINQNNGTDYSIEDVEICLDREIPTNELDNANIEKTKAETKQLEINILLSLTSQLPQEKLIQEICNLLDIDYLEIEEQVQEIIDENKIDLNKASEKLMNNNDNTEAQITDGTTPIVE